MASTDVASATQALVEQPVSRSTGSRPLLAFFVLVLLGLLCGPLFVNRIAYDAPKPTDGTVSFAHWGALTTPVELGGQWMFVWRGDAAHPAHERFPMKVPGTWEGLRTPSGTILPISGVGTYSSDDQRFAARVIHASRAHHHGRQPRLDRREIDVVAGDVRQLARHHEICRPLARRLDLGHRQAGRDRHRHGGVPRPRQRASGRTRDRAQRADAILGEPRMGEGFSLPRLAPPARGLRPRRRHVPAERQGFALFRAELPLLPAARNDGRLRQPDDGRVSDDQLFDAAGDTISSGQSRSRLLRRLCERALSEGKSAAAVLAARARFRLFLRDARHSAVARQFAARLAGVALRHDVGPCLLRLHGGRRGGGDRQAARRRAHLSARHRHLHRDLHDRRAGRQRIHPPRPGRRESI